MIKPRQLRAIRNVSTNLERLLPIKMTSVLSRATSLPAPSIPDHCNFAILSAKLADPFGFLVWQKLSHCFVDVKITAHQLLAHYF